MNSERLGHLIRFYSIIEMLEMLESDNRDRYYSVRRDETRRSRTDEVGGQQVGCLRGRA